ncbi:hypothetical protein GWI33_018056 [Rhynchophorus ferrugineus]|uniref:C2H2-type domain-containing protein n=1 Tax=Rhynchophorus ferrugineus TaxID=354439 RepID=A0A834M6U7_RHYFE|nr:hypothetical protein GWI33_018056 [Rhynchophorus ferrugineus]
MFFRSPFSCAWTSAGTFSRNYFLCGAGCLNCGMSRFGEVSSSLLIPGPSQGYKCKHPDCNGVFSTKSGRGVHMNAAQKDWKNCRLLCGEATMRPKVKKSR